MPWIKKVANDPRVAATILPVGSGLTIAQNCDIEGRMFLPLYKEVPIILPTLFLPKSMLLLLLFHWIIIFYIVIELPFAISLSTSTKVSFLLLRLWRVTLVNPKNKAQTGIYSSLTQRMWKMHELAYLYLSHIKRRTKKSQWKVNNLMVRFFASVIYFHIL